MEPAISPHQSPTARAMGDARLHIKQRHVANCMRADPAYGAIAAQDLKLRDLLVAVRARVSGVGDQRRAPAPNNRLG
jgi:hypothetical protein